MTMKKSMKFVLLPALLLASASVQAVTCNGSIPPSNPDSVYADHDDGTVTDTRTGLMWKKCVEGLSGADCATGSAQTYTWSGALTQAENSMFAGYSDWRLPNIRELRSLVEECRRNPAINDGVFTVNGASLFVWSGSPHADDSGRAWSVSFSNGGASSGVRGNPRGVRLVRAGQSFAPLPYSPPFSSLQAVAIPTLSQWAALALTGLLGLISLAVMRRRKGR